VQVVSIKTGELVGTFVGHKAVVTCIKKCNSSDANKVSVSNNVVSASLDGTVIVWNKVNFDQNDHNSITISFDWVVVCGWLRISG
jgi:WD40 repeat protein